MVPRRFAGAFQCQERGSRPSLAPAPCRRFLAEASGACGQGLTAPRLAPREAFGFGIVESTTAAVRVVEPEMKAEARIFAYVS